MTTLAFSVSTGDPVTALRLGLSNLDKTQFEITQIAMCKLIDTEWNIVIRATKLPEDEDIPNSTA